MISLLLSLAGAGISLYLWSGKWGTVPLICGNIGDCVTVNASPYSEIFGVPVAAMGFGLYLALAALSLLAERDRMHGRRESSEQRGSGQRRHEGANARGQWLVTAGFSLAFGGALAALYLTGVEAFVLGTYCLWCVLSWIDITALAVIWGRRLTLDAPENRERRAD